MSNIPFVTFLFSLSWLVGMGIYATYFNCDPYKAGYIEKTDEILPYFIMERLTYIPGFLGLFMATLFNGSLWWAFCFCSIWKSKICFLFNVIFCEFKFNCFVISKTICETKIAYVNNLSLQKCSIYVSTLNSVATVSWEDFIAHLPAFRGLTDFKQLCAIKTLGVIYAVICMGLAYVVSMFSGVIEISMFVNAATSGTLVGVFILAMLVPFANGKGASVGMIASHLTIIALAIVSSLSKGMLEPEFLPTSIEGCANTTNHSLFLYETHIPDYQRISHLNFTYIEAPLAEDLVVERWVHIFYATFLHIN